MLNIAKQLEFDKQLDLLQIRQFRRTGDIQIITGLYQKYAHLVYGVCLKYLKNRSAAISAVKNILEEITVTAQKQDIPNFKGWLYVSTKNYCIKELKANGGSEAPSSLWKNEEKKIIKSGFELHPLDNDTITHDSLLDCMKRLTDQQKQCVNLFYSKKKCYREIAQALSIDEAAVKKHIFTSKQNLKNCMEENHGQ
jgi:RNA polymerase sigma-70 factor, ECF subfamily